MFRRSVPSRVITVVDLFDRGRIAERVALHVRIELHVPDGVVAVGRGQPVKVKPREGVAEAGLALLVEGFNQQDRLGVRRDDGASE